mgnify:CR=1 FL=1
MQPRAKTDYIVVHCSATKPSMDIGSEKIRDWHVNERGWRDIGYHKVIRRNGEIEDGRDIRDSGAHAAGYNSKSVGVCMVGGMAEDNSAENNFTDKTLWCPLMSLPHRFKLTTERIPFAKGYLQNDRKRQNWWNKQLQRKKGHRLIALNWQGNPGHEKKIYSLDRSFAFQELLRFNRLENTEFIAIQKGEGLEQLETDAGLEFVKGQEIFNKTMDFRDTAAVMANCDLVISSDSGVVHLAGAMGVACWVALRWIPEWRWGLEGEMTPWYDSVKLFRQKSQGDWASAIDHMLRVLQT